MHGNDAQVHKRERKLRKHIHNILCAAAHARLKLGVR